MTDVLDSKEAPLTPHEPPGWGSMARTEPDLRANLRLVIVAWVFGAAWMYVTTGAAMTRYAKSLGLGEFGFGLLAAMPYLGALVQLPASYFLERFGHRKAMFILAGLLHRSMWLVIAAIPWFAPQATWWWMLLMILVVSTLLANTMTPAWMTWMADMVPGRIRGRYFSHRGQYGRFVGVIVTIGMGLAMDWAERADTTGLMLRQLISIAMVAAALSGMFDIALFRWVPDQRHSPPQRRVEFMHLLRQPLADRNFRRFLGFSATLTFAIGYVGQFIWLYLFDVVGMTNMRANMMLVAVPLIVSMLSFPLWGRMVDKLGCKPVLLIAGLLIVHGGASWILVTPDHWWIGYMGSISATAAWPGVELAMMNLLLGISGSQHHGRMGSAYVAVHSTVVALAGIASGLFGGFFAEAMSTWKGTLFGWPLTYHGLLLLTSAGLRLLALGWLIGLEEPRAVTTRNAARYMVAHIYSNLQQAVFAPTRGLWRLGRITYRFLPLRQRGE